MSRGNPQIIVERRTAPEERGPVALLLVADGARVAGRVPGHAWVQTQADPKKRAPAERLRRALPTAGW